MKHSEFACYDFSHAAKGESALQINALQLSKEEIVETKSKYSLYLAALSTLALLFPLGASARDNKHSVDIPAEVQIGSTQLKPGNYTVEWQGTGHAVQVNFRRDGKTMVTVPGTLKTNDDQVTGRYRD
jgi:hypothetical protein